MLIKMIIRSDQPHPIVYKLNIPDPPPFSTPPFSLLPTNLCPDIIRLYGMNESSKMLINQNSEYCFNHRG